LDLPDVPANPIQGRGCFDLIFTGSVAALHAANLLDTRIVPRMELKPFLLPLRSIDPVSTSHFQSIVFKSISQDCFLDVELYFSIA